MEMIKPVYRYDIPQNSDEWMAERVRRIGASNSYDLLMAKTTKGYQNLKDRLIEETVTGLETESKSFLGNYYTDRGHELEPVARDDYELRTFEEVKLVGMVILNEWSHCSPDGLIGEDTLHQIKCPIFNTQLKYLRLIAANKGLSDNDLLSKIDKKYFIQCQYELYVSDRKTNIWTSFHPNLKAIDLVVKRDELIIEQIKARLVEIKEEVLNEVELIKKINL